MKRVVLLFAFLLASACALSQDLTVASYNLRNDNESDRRAGNGWDKRCGKVCEIIDYNGFDIVGTQEVKHGMLLDMCAALPGYGYVGVGRDDGATANIRRSSTAGTASRFSTAALSGFRRSPTARARGGTRPIRVSVRGDASGT